MQPYPFYGLRAYALPPDGGGRVGGWAVLHDGCGGALEPGGEGGHFRVVDDRLLRSCNPSCDSFGQLAQP